MTRHHDRGETLASPVSATIFEGRCARVHTRENPLRYETGPEYRRLDQVKRIVALLVGVPVRLDHEGRDVGVVIGARLDGEHAIARMLITDPAGLAAIKSTHRELSLGYSVRLDDERNQQIESITELALCERARCGPSCATKTDADRDLYREAATALRYRIGVAWRGDDAPCCASCDEDHRIADERAAAADLRERIAYAWSRK